VCSVTKRSDHDVSMRRRRPDQLLAQNRLESNRLHLELLVLVLALAFTAARVICAVADGAIPEGRAHQGLDIIKRAGLEAETWTDLAVRLLNRVRIESKGDQADDGSGRKLIVAIEALK